MPTQVKVTGGVLEVEAIMGPGQPGHDLPLPGGPPRPGHELPSSDLHPWVPGHLPDPPPSVFPPLTPSHPIQPAPPGVPPGCIWPPFVPPSGTLPTRPPVAPGHDLPAPPGAHPGGGPIEKTYWLIAGIPGVGWRYVAIDPSLVIGYPMPPGAQPKQ